MEAESLSTQASTSRQRVFYAVFSTGPRIIFSEALIFNFSFVSNFIYLGVGMVPSLISLLVLSLAKLNSCQTLPSPTCWSKNVGMRDASQSMLSRSTYRESHILLHASFDQRTMDNSVAGQQTRSVCYQLCSTWSLRSFEFLSEKFVAWTWERKLLVATRPCRVVVHKSRRVRHF